MRVSQLLNQVDLAQIQDSQWQAFRPGVDYIALHGKPAVAGSAALLRYQPGAKVPRHHHVAAEYILVLSGAQQDDYGDYGVGQLVINRGGSEHRVWSNDGCIVLAVWTGDLKLLEPV